LKKENPSNMADARVWIGGLVRNGATDTPILNAKLKIKESNFSKKAAFVTKVECVFGATKTMPQS
jgi:hypothetical protein